MSIQCQYCSSTNTQKRGTRSKADGSVTVRGYCNDCSKFFSVNQGEESSEQAVSLEATFVADKETLNSLYGHARYVICSAVNNSDVNEDFFNTILNYCEHNEAKLIVIPLCYRNVSLYNVNEEVWYDPFVKPYLIKNNFEIGDNIKVLGALKTQATAINPLSGIDAASKGNTVIIGHTQVALKTLPRLSEKYPPIATTTGCVTFENYSDTKVGYIANFNHSMAACVVEVDGHNHFIRHLNWDGEGFYDFENYYTPDSITGDQEIDAIVLGDTHTRFVSEEVEQATFTNQDSICNTLKPKSLIYGDCLDFNSRSHHGIKNVFEMYAKHHGNADDVYEELTECLDYLGEMTPEYAKAYIVSSNHNDHLCRWLIEADPKKDPQNALIYHLLMYKMLEQTKMGSNGASYPDPLKLFAEHIGVSDKLVFLGRNESFQIHGIELSQHGDKGANGAKSSEKTFSNINSKFVTGHRHSPSIEKGSYIVGTSTGRLSYANGLSSWDNAHCIIYPNGRRQMVFMRDGKWRLS